MRGTAIGSLRSSPALAVTIGVAWPLTGVDTGRDTGVGIAGSFGVAVAAGAAAGGAAIGALTGGGLDTTIPGFSRVSLGAVASLTACIALSPLPSSTTLIRSSGCLPTLIPSQALTKLTATSYAVESFPACFLGSSNWIQHIPICIPVFGCTLLSKLRIVPYCRIMVLIWSAVVSGFS